MKDLTKGKPSTLILSFALPVFLGNLLQLTYSLADTRIGGGFLKEDALAAVGATSPLSGLIIGFLMGLANGFAIVTAQKFGAGNREEVRKSFALSLVMGSVISLALTVLGLLLLHPILGFLNVPDHLTGTARQYIFIIIAGMLATFLYDTCAASLRALGDTVTPLVILLVCWFYMIRRYEILRLKKEDFFGLERNMMKNMLSAGLSMGLVSSLVNLGTLALQTSINRLGRDIIVAHTAARKITEMFMIMFGVFGQTMATFCGQNAGAGRMDRVRHGIGLAVLYTGIWSVMTVIFSFTIGKQLIYLVTGSHNETVIRNAANYLKFDTIFYFVTAVISVLRNAMQGLGETVIPLAPSALEMIGKVVIAVTLVPLFGYTGVIVAEPIVWIIMVIPLIVKILKMPELKRTV